MKLYRSGEKERGEQVLPLVNIVFLLLVFFMLAGAFTRPEPFHVAPPTTSGAAASTPSPAIVLVGAGQLAFQGELLRDLDDLRGRIRDWAKAQPAELQVKIEGSLPAGRLVAVLRTLESAGIASVILLTVADAT